MTRLDPPLRLAFAAIILALAAWLWRRQSRAATIASLVVGTLWTVMFGASVFASSRSSVGWP
jgi:hypothetical protein